MQRPTHFLVSFFLFLSVIYFYLVGLYTFKLGKILVTVVYTQTSSLPTLTCNTC